MDTWETRIYFVRGHRSIESSTRSSVRSLDKSPQSKQPFAMGTRSRKLSSRSRHEVFLRSFQSSPSLPQPSSPPHGTKPTFRKPWDDQGSSRRVTKPSYFTTIGSLWNRDGSSTSR